MFQLVCFSAGQGCEAILLMINVNDWNIFLSLNNSSYTVKGIARCKTKILYTGEKNVLNKTYAS